MKHPLSFQITNPHTGFFRCARHSGLLRALPAALICGCSAVAMAAEIHDAVRDGDAAAVSRLLKKDPKLVNLPDEDHAATPLHLAVDAGNLDLVRILLKAGASVTLKTDDADPEASAMGCRPLHYAAIFGNVDVAKALVGRKADVNAAQVPTGLRPLHLAVANGDISDQGDWSPLHHAALNGAVGVVRLLLDHRGPVEVANSLGNTPLHHAAIVRVGRADFEAIAGQPANAQVGMDAINKSNPADKLKIVKLLLAKGAKPNVKNLGGATPHRCSRQVRHAGDPRDAENPQAVLNREITSKTPAIAPFETHSIVQPSMAK
jgi:ankyrin repeat protein